MITGAAGYEVSSSTSITLNAVTDFSSNGGTFPYNNTYRGVLASTTGNVYGIYDMSGGSWEPVAGNLDEYIGNAGSSGIFDDIYNGDSPLLKSKYFDLYKNGSTVTDRQSNYEANLDKKGDATIEVSKTGSTTGWFSDYAIFLDVAEPWIMRGGGNNNTINAGVFYCSNHPGNANNGYSFRPVLVCPL